MDGRIWHTSGNNTGDRERGMLFGYYSADFLRQQQNWAVLTPRGNARLADYLNFAREEGAKVEAVS